MRPFTTRLCLSCAVSGIIAMAGGAVDGAQVVINVDCKKGAA